MPRNSSGVYSLPAGNPVASNTPILASWANALASDLAAEITNSLDRNGRGGMLAAFKNADGTVGAPGITFQNEASTGFTRTGAGEVKYAGQGVERVRFNNVGLTVPFTSGKVITNNLESYDTHLSLNALSGFGLLFKINNIQKAVMDSSGRFGIGIATPVMPLHVVGSVRLAGDVHIEWFNGAETSRTGYLQGLSGTALRLMAENGHLLQFGAQGAIRTTIDTTGGLTHVGAINTNTGDFNFSGVGVIDSTAPRMFAGAGVLFLQNGSGDQIAFRNKTGNTHSVWRNNGNLNVGFDTDQGYKLAVAGNVLATNVVTSGAGEGLRIANDNAFLSGYDSSNSDRSGYLQFSNGGDTVLMNDDAGNLILGTDGVTRFLVTAAGHIQAAVNSTYDLGDSTHRFRTIYGQGANFNGATVKVSNISEGFRVSNDSGFISIYNSADATRIGYLQGNAGTNLTLNADPTTPTLLLAAPTTIQENVNGTARRSQTATLADFNTAARTAPVSIGFSGTPSFNCQLTNVFYLGTMTANVTGLTLSNPVDGQMVSIRFVQDGTGGRTVTPGNMGATNAPLLAGSPNTAANKVSWLNVAYLASAARWEGTWTALP